MQAMPNISGSIRRADSWHGLARHNPGRPGFLRLRDLILGSAKIAMQLNCDHLPRLGNGCILACGLPGCVSPVLVMSAD